MSVKVLLTTIMRGFLGAKKVLGYFIFILMSRNGLRILFDYTNCHATDINGGCKTSFIFLGQFDLGVVASFGKLISRNLIQ